VRYKAILAVVFLVAMLVFLAVAQDEPVEEMPPMGPPEQMKDIAFLEGVWDVAMVWQNDKDTSVWDTSTAVCIYKPILEGCAMYMTFESVMMNMPFNGVLIQSYDREKKEWQAMWVDNMGARMALYTGEDRMVVSVEDIWQEQAFHSRMTNFNETPTKFDWTMEISFDGGQNWTVVRRATYTKRK
jgi:hypothetical protein